MKDLYKSVDEVTRPIVLTMMPRLNFRRQSRFAILDEIIGILDTPKFVNQIVVESRMGRSIWHALLKLNGTEFCQNINTVCSLSKLEKVPRDDWSELSGNNNEKCGKRIGLN